MMENIAEKKSFFEWLRSNYKTVINVALTALFMGLGLWTLIYYLTGPALGYFHSDCSDSLLWSQAMIETGEILSEDFYYAAILPFGSPIYMVPVLRIFGYTMTAQVVSTCIFAVIFLLSALSLFRAMKWSYWAASLGAFCMAMLLSGSVKLREIMWEHVIYYSLGIIFLMLVLNLTFRLMDKLERIGEKRVGNRILAVVYCVLLLLLCAGIATDGLQLLALTVIPVAAALLAVVIFDADTRLWSLSAAKKCSVCAVMGVGAGLGMIVLDRLTRGGEIAASYADGYSGWSATSEWVANLEKFPAHWFSLFGVTVKAQETLFSGSSIISLLKLLCAVVLFICPFLLFVFYKRLSKYERAVAWAHVVVLAVTMVGFVCGELSNVNWRLTPLLGSSVIATLVLVKSLFDIKPVGVRVGALLAAFLLVISLLTARDMLSMDRDFGKDDPLQEIADILEEKGYTRGYATFWNASEVTLRSDSAVTVVTCDIKNQKISETHYQTLDSWFDDVEGQEDYFVIFTESEYAKLPGGGETYIESLGAQIIDRIELDGYIILVSDRNIF